MDVQRIVREGYDAIGERYHEWSHDAPTRIRYVEALRDRLAPGSLVVDVGCGPGDPATRMLSERHRAIGVDLSFGQLRIAREKAPRALLVQADVTRLALRPGSVDAVTAFFVTGHLPAGEHAAFYARTASWLRPGGVLLTTAPRSAGEGTEDGWLGAETMFFGGIGREATVAAIQAAGMAVESVDDVEDAPGERFLWITAVRRQG